ncbi:MAG TPA: glycosyltransferase family 39 protein [Chitinophagaceae bacterium]|nr:glycosyltransferase family 39 protein [Chitinophagaceae bacterium]
MKQLLQKIKVHYQLALIFLAGIGIRLYMAAIDPFLHEWDERYHALVARNMMKTPLKPMLIAKPFALYDPEQWCCNHIWLHKQPLFLWQMALSMKLFGVSEFTLRLPSVLMGSAMILLVYRITLLLTTNKLTAILAAMLMCCSHFQLELISGKNGMDHNDVAFGFYILASTWSYLEYLKRPKWYWAVITGLFSGCAILNKWLTGLLIFLPWGVKVVCTKAGKRLSAYGNFSLGLLVCIAVFLPWQLFILHAYPSEARYEFTLNSRHIWEAVERHARDNWFYYDNFKSYFGEINYYLLTPGIFILLLKYTQKRIEAMTLIGMFLLMFVFFTFIVQTKMISYFFVVAPIGFVMIAVSMKGLIALFRYNKVMLVALTAICLFKALNPLDIYESRQNNAQREHMIRRTEIYKNLSKLMPDSVRVLINVPEFEHPNVMFYNPQLTAYHYWPSEQELAMLERNKIPLATFNDHNQYILPEHVRRYPYLSTVAADLNF